MTCALRDIFISVIQHFYLAITMTASNFLIDENIFICSFYSVSHEGSLRRQRSLLSLA